MDDAIDDTTETVDDLTGAVDDGLDGLGSATTEKRKDDGGSLVAATSTVDTAVQEAERQVEDATTALADANAAVTSARASVAAAERAVAQATAALDELVDEATAELGGTATQLREELTRIRGEVEGLLDQVASRLIALPDLAALLDELHDGLAGVPVISLGGVSFDVVLRAGSRTATADAGCNIDTITVFGQTLTSPSCDEASSLLATVPGTLGALLEVLPVDQLPLPRITGPSVTTDTNSGSEDGVTRARADITALELEVPPVSLAALTDGLTRHLDGLLAEALAAARALPGADLGTSGAKRFVPANLLTTLDDLRAQVDELPLGAQLNGLRTLGIEVAVGRLAAEVLHGATADGPLALGPPVDDMPAPEPEEDPEGTPADEPPSLPATGGGLSLLPLALVGAALLLRRRRS